MCASGMIVPFSKYGKKGDKKTMFYLFVLITLQLFMVNICPLSVLMGGQSQKCHFLSGQSQRVQSLGGQSQICQNLLSQSQNVNLWISRVLVARDAKVLVAVV